MQRIALNLLAGLVGFAVGEAVLASPIAAVFGPAAVTWDATNCPAGTYTIISTAKSLDSGRTYATAPLSVRLPRPTVVQQFTNLPPGTYTVTATVRGRHGRMLTSGPQTLIEPGDATGRPAQDRGHRKPTPRQPAAAASSRPRAVTAPAPTASVASSVATATATTTNAVPIPLGWPSELTDLLGRLLDPGSSGAVERAWTRIDLADTDGDGIIDLARIQFADGEIWVWTAR